VEGPAFFKVQKMHVFLISIDPCINLKFAVGKGKIRGCSSIPGQKFDLRLVEIFPINKDKDHRLKLDPNFFISLFLAKRCILNKHI